MLRELAVRQPVEVGEHDALALAGIQLPEAFGERARINLPGSVGDANWSYRMQRRTDQLLADPRTAHMAELARRFGRLGG